MQARRFFFLGFAAALMLLVGGASLAQAAPDISLTGVVNEDDGLLGVCDAPCFSIEKHADVYFPGNPSDPTACPPGDYAYVYQLTHIGGSGTKNGGAPGGLTPPMTQFEIEVLFSLVTTAGFLPGPNVSPSTTIVSPLNVVTWDFGTAPIFPPPSAPLDMSNPLFICSPAAPGSPTDNMVSATGVFLDAPGECIGPVPAECDIEVDKTCCVPIPSPGAENPDICQGKVIRAKFEVVGGECSDTTNTQNGKAKCTGDNPIQNPVLDEVDITILKDASKISATPDMDVAVGETFELTSNTGNLKASTKFELSGPGGDQTLTIHTSCSKALRCNDQFGALRLVELETTDGGVVTCDPPGGGGGPQEETACVSPPAAEGTPCDSKLVEAVFRFNASDCQNPLPNPQNGEAECEGDASDATLPVNVMYTGKKAAKTTVAPSSGIGEGDTFTVSATGMKSLHPNVELKITDVDSVEQSVRLHVSCSQPLACGDQFGSLTLVGFTTKNGTQVDCNDEPPPAGPFQQACECPIAPPTPHCTGDLEGIQLVYLKDLFGADCSVSNPQSGAASCTGDDLTDDNVSINVTTSGVSADPNSGIDELEVFTIEKVVMGLKQKLPSNISFEATDGSANSQTVAIHTSCSKPLNLGDRFGDFAVFALDRGDGDSSSHEDDSDTDSDSDGTKPGEDGLISLGCVIEYQYKVTNPNPVDLVNVSVDDNPHGPIASGETIPAGGMKTFFATKTLYESTTNTGTVTGELATGGECTAGMDDVTVTVTLPPSGSFDCNDAKPIDELSMVWDGVGNICVRAYDGSVGGTLLKTDVNLAPGETFTVSGMGGSPNDQQWQIFNAFCGGAPLGISEFHISCSDSAMNGVEDCGAREGNGKSNDLGLINDWLLEGIVGDETLDCTPAEIPSGGGGGVCGLGFELALLLPGLMWLRRRRSLR